MARWSRRDHIQQWGLMHRLKLIYKGWVVVSDTAPPAFLQLTGHPVRWHLLAELARSDYTVRELTGLVNQPQNLISYHLAKLRGAGLVVARRSSADRRDSYYSADLTRLGGMLAAAGGALHPGLALVPPRSLGDEPAPRRRVHKMVTP